MDDLDFLDEELEKPTVFADESKLSSEYVPTNLLYRENYLRNVLAHFRSILSEIGATRKMVITGPVGSGKTSIAKKFGTWLEKRGMVEKINIKYMHINCRRNKTPFMILLDIAQDLNSHVPSRGYSADELMELIVEILETKKMTLFLVLDEVDFVSSIDLGNLLYALSRTGDDLKNPQHKIGLILISQVPNFMSILDHSTKSSLSAKVMKLRKYKREELENIIHERVKESFISGAVSEGSIYLAAEITCERGDARRALELMWYAGKHADKDGSSIVYPDHIRLAKADIEPAILRYDIIELTKHKLMFLLGIAREFRYTHAAYLTTGSAEEAYHIVCEEFNQEARKHTQIWEYLREFKTSGILFARQSSKGQRGTTKHISIQDVSAVELEKEVLKRLQEMKSGSMVIH